MNLHEYRNAYDEGSVSIKDNKEIITQFCSQFQKIRAMGYIKSHRSHDTGIGKTFEDLMGIQENNIDDVDFMNFIELKSKREASESMLTLFTKTPDYPRGSNVYLRDTYGMVDEITGLKRLHTTISGKEYNTFSENIGFKLSINCAEEKIYISIKNLITNDIYENNIYYTFETLRKIITKKCAIIAFVIADTKIENGIEFFKYTNAQLLIGLTFEKFLQGINTGIILYDIRIGSYKSGRLMGRIHDHGSGFRVKRSNIPDLFQVIYL